MPFPITCAACHKTFSIADDVFERKVKGRVVTIKCKQCQAGIRVDGTKQTPVFSVSDSMRPPSGSPPDLSPAAPGRASPAVKQDAKPAPKVAPPGSAPKAAAPKAAATTAMGKAASAAQPLVNPSGAATQATSTTARHVPPRAPPLAPSAQAPSPTVEMPPGPAARPARVAATESTSPAIAKPSAAVENLWAVDYPDGEDRELTLVQIERELVAGAIDEHTLVWRDGMNEWLELGQLPELRALHARRAPQPPARPPLPSESDVTLPQLPLPLAGPPPFESSGSVIDFARHDVREAPAAPVPAANFSTVRGSHPPTPPTSASNPRGPAQNFQPVAPAPAPLPALVARGPARPAPTTLGALPPISDVAEWPPKSRLPLFGAAFALLALGGLIFYLTRSSADQLPPLTPISALPASVSSARPAEPAPSTTPEPAGESVQSNAALQPPGHGALTAPNAGFAELFADGARSADQTHGASATARFNAAAAKAALANAANQTAQCREKSGPTGKATVVVTFAPGGKVENATVNDSPFAGTSRGACIAAAMRGATVPPFSGPPGTVTKIISIR